jgi:hypothetical protein
MVNVKPRPVAAGEVWPPREWDASAYKRNARSRQEAGRFSNNKGIKMGLSGGQGRIVYSEFKKQYDEIAD